MFYKMVFKGERSIRYPYQIKNKRSNNLTLVLISKNEFLEMFSLGILSGSRKDNKEWTVTSRKRPSRRKKRYVDEATYSKYLNVKSKQQ